MIHLLNFKHLHLYRSKPKKALESIKSDNAPVHIIISGDYYAYSNNSTLDLRNDMEPFLLKTLKKLKIRTASVNILRMLRYYLITKYGF